MDSYGIEYNKKRYYREDAQYLTNEDETGRLAWRREIVQDSKRFNPGVADSISLETTLADVLQPWIEQFAVLGEVPVSAVRWHESWAISQVRDATKRVTARQLVKWLQRDAYWLDATPGGRRFEKERPSVIDQTQWTIDNVLS